MTRLVNFRIKSLFSQFPKCVDISGKVELLLNLVCVMNTQRNTIMKSYISIRKFVQIQYIVSKRRACHFEHLGYYGIDIPFCTMIRFDSSLFLCQAHFVMKICLLLLSGRVILKTIELSVNFSIPVAYLQSIFIS